MATTAEVLSDLTAAGIRREARGGTLHAAPRRALTDSNHGLIRAHRAPLEALLAELETAAGEDWPQIRDRPEALEAFVRVLKTRAMREQGKVPAHYTQTVECAHCGPVWLWEGAPKQVLGCPWCFNRAKGRPIPRP